MIGKIALIDTFILSPRRLSISQHEFMMANAVNYKASNDEKGTKIGSRANLKIRTKFFI